MINRAPEFAASAVDLSVDEGLSVGDVVYQASATDLNGDIWYTAWSDLIPTYAD